MGRAGADHAGATGRLHPLGHARHHPRRPHRLCAVLQSRLLHPAPGRDLRIVEGRHVVPRRLHRLRRRGDAVLPARTTSRSCRSATSPPRSRRSGCSSGGSPISSTANCGAGRPIPACPGRWCFPMAGRCRAIRASSTKPGSRASCCSSILARDDPRRRAEAAGPDPRQLHRASMAWPASSANCSANPTRSSASCGAD